MHKYWILISLEEIIQIWIIPSLPEILISSTYTRFIVENRDIIWCNKKGLVWHYIFWKNILPWNFFNLVPRVSFAPKCTFSIKFRSQMKLWHRIDLIIVNNFLNSCMTEKLGTVASDIMYVKPFICVVGK